MMKNLRSYDVPLQRYMALMDLQVKYILFQQLDFYIGLTIFESTVLIFSL